ncbi:hypothetical protein [Sphingomonas sp.]|uniref:hypothetical protein n=1 Tax=Sphingomonas sp. TaxID=28214 RepID=UPI003D6D0ADA
MAGSKLTLGSQLRHLIDLLDGAVEKSYRDAGLDYRPRYTPVVRALVSLGEGSVAALAAQTGLTHSAISQTLAQMARNDLVGLRKGADARERIAMLTPRALALLPALERHWAATNRAASGLDSELTAPLSHILNEAIRALAVDPFGDRIDRARHDLETIEQAAAPAASSNRRDP